MGNDDKEIREFVQFCLFGFIFVMTIISLIATFVMMDELMYEDDTAILYVWAAISISCLSLMTYIASKRIK